MWVEKFFFSFALLSTNDRLKAKKVSKFQSSWTMLNWILYWNKKWVKKFAKFFKVVKGPPWAGRDSSIKNEVHSVRIFLEWFWYIPTYFLVPKVMMGPKPIQSSIFSFIHVRFKIAKLDNKFIKCRFDFIKTLTALCKKGSYWIVKIGYKKLMETF